MVDGVEVHSPPLPGDHALPLRQRHPVEPHLVDALRALADPYGAMDVALTAARLSDPVVLTRVLFDGRQTRAVDEPPPTAGPGAGADELDRLRSDTVPRAPVEALLEAVALYLGKPHVTHGLAEKELTEHVAGVRRHLNGDTT